jgi:hypothetical protein
MKNSNAFQSFVHLFRVNMNCAKVLCRMSVVAALAFALPHQAQAQTVNQLYFPLADATGTTSPSSTALGGLSGINLTLYNGSSTAVNLHGAIGTGLDGGRALDLTIGDTANAGGSANGSGAANAAVDSSDANIALVGGNTVSSFVASMWINEGGALSATTGTFPRLFVLSATGANDGSANTIGVKFQQGNQFIISIDSSPATANYYSAGVGASLSTTFTPFPADQWIFVAWVYDGTNIYNYIGTNGVPATLQGSYPAAGLTVNLGATPTLVVGNRSKGGSRGFYGQVQDFSFSTGVPTNALAFVQGAQLSQQLTLNVNFIDASINNAYGGGTAPAPAAFSGAAAIGSPGDIWNGVGGFTYSAYPDGATYTTPANTLKYAEGSLSTVGFSLSAPGGSYDSDTVNWGDGPWLGTTYQNLFQTLISTGAGSPSGYVDLTGLSPNAVYNLYVYSAANAVRTTEFTVGGGGGTQAVAYDGATTTLVEGTDYVEFTNVTADGSGNLAISFTNGVTTPASSEGDFNGFQLEFVSGTPPGIVPPIPTVSLTTTNLAGLTLCTNTSVTFSAVSSVANISSFTVSVTTNALYPSNPGTTLALPGMTTVGLGTPNATVTIPLTPGLTYSITVTATDSNSQTSQAATAKFDTIAPSLVIEASDYNYNGGSFMDTTAYGGVWQYYTVNDSDNINGLENHDFFKSGGEGPGALFYRDLSDSTIAPNAAPYVTVANSDSVSEQKYAVATTGTNEGVNDFPELGIGYDTDNPGDWQNYTRTFGPGGSAPAGNYNIWLFMASSGTGEQARLFTVSPSPYNSSSTLSSNQLGQFGTVSFAENDWNGYEYVPLTGSAGNVLSVPIANGVQTFQIKVGTGQGPNLGFLMLVPAASVGAPGLVSVYPDGTHPFEQTNSISFVATAGTGASFPSSADIHLVLNGVDVTPGVTFTAVGTNWAGSYPLRGDTVYSAVINLTNNLNLSSSIPISFDTFNSNYYTWEAVDYDFSTNNNTSSPPQQGTEVGPGWVSAQFIDDPIPTGDINGTGTGPVGTEATNSYFGYPENWTPGNDPYGAGAIAQQGIDVNVTANGQTIAYEQYRFGDGVGAQPSSDYIRPKFMTSQTTGWPAEGIAADPNVGPFNICYYDTGNWLNYTRHFPPGSYYVWGRQANNANYTNSLSVVTGAGSTNQTATVLGTFTDTNAQGFQAWHWLPLLDSNGNKVALNLTGAATTLRATALADNNMEFFMLSPGPFKLTPTVTGGQVKISFPVAPGCTYLVQYKSNLAASNWTTVYTITLNSDGAVTSVIPSSPSVTASGGIVTISNATPGYYTVALVQ